MMLVVFQPLSRTNPHLCGRKLRSLALFALLVVGASRSIASTPATSAQSAAPVAPLAGYVTSDDYPSDALDKGEQGTVEFLLTIGVDGAPTDCAVTNSSGSSSLDSASCRIMIERARFKPAKNATGKTVVGTYTGRISWRTEESEPWPAAVQTAFTLWSTCGLGEAAKLVSSDLTAGEIMTRAFAACAALEERIALELGKAKLKDVNPSKVIADVKKDAVERFPDQLARFRAALKGEVSK
jgi:TonB family protein